jgi:hypothetical protein
MLSQQDPTWFQKDINLQRVDVEMMAKEKLARINAGIIPLMAQQPPPEVRLSSVDVQSNA